MLPIVHKDTVRTLSDIYQTVSVATFYHRPMASLPSTTLKESPFSSHRLCYMKSFTFPTPTINMTSGTQNIIERASYQLYRDVWWLGMNMVIGGGGI